MNSGDPLVTQLNDLVRTAQLRGEVRVDRVTLSAIQTALTERRSVSRELAHAIASTIAHSAGVALAAHAIPEAARLAAEVGNNCAQTVILILEAFLDDGTIFAVPQKED